MIMEEDGEVYTEKMVQYHREISKHERQLKRDIIFNRRRGILGEVSDSKKQIITSKTVLTILQKIKRKSKLTDEDINTLTCAFIQNESNIITFLNADSNLGLQALVRELTGVSSLIQLAVAECFVNMSLGNHKCCFKIAKSAGTYLITHLQGMNLNLKVPCIWALGNLVGSDIKTWKLLNSQGLLLLFLELLPITELQENVIYALTHYIKIGFNELLLIYEVCTKMQSMCEKIILEYIYSGNFFKDLQILCLLQNQ
ncbi:uncharacterized protein LOC142327439 isoform X2 [Lycorma delicatula]|uniref:uncharacterized protein LOC142327439 isoform X2 n=1 Tax=Lycorma delicatula TaxID=130591 RepID=UPI003F50FCF0